MRKLITGSVLALAVTLGTMGTAIAATPETMAPVARQTSVTLDPDLEVDGDLSNMPEIHDSDTSNE